MTIGAVAIASGPIAGSQVSVPSGDTVPYLAVEVSFTTGALEDPVWVDIAADARSWNILRGRGRELERFQPGRATVVLANLNRRYDSSYTGAGAPYNGNLRPMRRMRIRETFNGTTFPIFDGYVDKWQLDYPGTGHDATATIVATDAFKLFQRTQLPASVYRLEVDADAPTVWYRLDERKASDDDAALAALNAGTAGTASDGNYVGLPYLGGEALVVNDPGGSMAVVGVSESEGTAAMGVDGVYDLYGNDPFTIEAWCVPDAEQTIDSKLLWGYNGSGSGSEAFVDYLSSVPGDPYFRFSVTNTVPTGYAVDTTSGPSLGPHLRYHVVARFQIGTPLALTVNGVNFTGGTPAGTFNGTSTLLAVGYDQVFPGDYNWYGAISHFAVYTGLLSDARIAAHYAAGTHPWQGDTAGGRLNRILDIVGWPSALREFDTGVTTLQSATLNTPALEHLYKVAETEAGLFFMSRAGMARFVSFANQGINTPYVPQIIGDDTGEVGYTDITFTDGDEVIRNRATISRLNGVAKTDEDTSSGDEFGRFDFTLDGLLHDSDAYSADYAAFVVAEYAEPRRRVSSVTISSPPVGEEAIAYPMILGRELGEHVTIRNRPPGGGSTFEQTSVIEGIEMTGTPKHRSVVFSLSPIIVNDL